MAVACYPGSFNPPTTAHLAIAEAARAGCGVDRVDLVVSRVALAKEHVERPALADRIAVLDRVVRARSWLGLVVTEHQLLVDLAHGYDVLVLGADKWHQIHDVGFYGGSAAARDHALAALPPVAVVPRPGHDHVALPAGATVLRLPPEVAAMSSTGARAGRREWMVPEAAASGLWSSAGEAGPD
jgi:hypothetical protein